jgi:hypothetical protein
MYRKARVVFILLHERFFIIGPWSDLLCGEEKSQRIVPFRSESKELYISKAARSIVDFQMSVCRHQLVDINLDQGDLIGRVFAFWAIVYFGQFFDNNKSNQHFGLLFS